jgi:hypothetical protein
MATNKMIENSSSTGFPKPNTGAAPHLAAHNRLHCLTKSPPTRNSRVSVKRGDKFETQRGTRPSAIFHVVQYPTGWEAKALSSP